MPQQYADLELSLHRFDMGTYSVEFRYSLPDSEADIGLGQGDAVRMQIDPTAEVFNHMVADAKEYGKALSDALFSADILKTAFSQARAAARAKNVPLHLRLRISPSASELYPLRWETLLDPVDNTPLATNENIFFSRYLSSSDWTPVRLRPKGNLRALVAVAYPTGLTNLGFSPINVEEEVSRAKTGLDEVAVTFLPSSGKCASMNEIIDGLRKEESDILYLVCHGAMVNNKPVMYLENVEGKIEAISGEDFVTRIKELPRQPRLAVLISCQSAGKGMGNAQAALGPRLVEAGVPAVLAMQDNLSMETAKQFLPVFFRELKKDGQIDRALTVARSMIRMRPDHWVPVLFMRLKSGRLWYTPGMSAEGKHFEVFTAILSNNAKQRTTPIIGPGLVEPLFGSLREVARGWAEKFHYPLAPYERESLPHVAQYLSVSVQPPAPFDELEKYLRQHIYAIHKNALPPELLSGNPSLEKLIEAVGANQRQNNEMEPHRILAQFDLPVYITANPDGLLEAALREVGKEPQSILCPWNEDIERPNVQDPDSKHPLVYHFFGRWDQPESLVLTEDQYFAFLIGVTRNKDIIPKRVLEALNMAGLLFLGFQTDEWPFRVLFQIILAQEGGNKRKNYAQVAAQVEPEDERLIEPQRAIMYLEKYFRNDAKIEIYWGSPQEFLSELAGQAKSQ